ncbi:hypothetical protein LEP1GSC202_0425 [Leptospira yanagawae serovar Saopaulo str. Sao Paulo = ATCC 700523]|uniref:DUF1819 family protein n=1 Tax=Leptospira yanagawae serovar Saopaulo str. Sao Paulo = ATCC 700523 TaxID=1249483 RepID=A0A5E8HHI9_9LEPT|nr:hypothetical protein [Leptospira yanagawae]EOQ90765.1 hypothetical protein LEP1GSC202_0425 [Leptospira yanagawae serovar Saopaulo str. Sao Paulo = ATCC 700523]
MNSQIEKVNDSLLALPKIANKINFHLLKVSSFPEESKTYVERYLLEKDPIDVDTVIRERWYSNKTDKRVKNLLLVFKHRFLNYDIAFRFLQLNLGSFNRVDWVWVILAHLSLSDPLFRWYMNQFLYPLPEKSTFTRDQLSRELSTVMSEETRAFTRNTYSAKLITATKSLKLVHGQKIFVKENLLYSSLGFYYFLFLLKSISFDIDQLHQTSLYRGFFKSKQDLFDGFEKLKSENYISLMWYGEQPSIQLKQMSGLVYP